MLPRIPSDDNYFKYLGFLRTGEQPKRPMVFDISTPPPSGVSSSQSRESTTHNRLLWPLEQSSTILHLATKL